MTSDAPHDLTEESLSTFAADTPSSTASEVAEPDDASPQPDTIEEEDDYTGIDWDRLKGFQQPYQGLRRTPSFIWKHGYRIQRRNPPRDVYWQCGYCHQHRIKGGLCQTSKATSSAKSHLKKDNLGYQINKDSVINYPNKPA